MKVEEFLVLHARMRGDNLDQLLVTGKLCGRKPDAEVQCTSRKRYALPSASAPQSTIKFTQPNINTVEIR